MKMCHIFYRMKMNLTEIASCIKEQGLLVGNPGLLCGQMGAAIFMFHYARYTNDESYEDYGCELIDSIQKKISRRSAMDYMVGNTGIGTGISYLIKNRFLKAEDNDVLSEFDIRVFQELLFRKNNQVNLFFGVSGWLRYFYFRIKEHKDRQDEDCIRILDNKHYLMHIIDYFYLIKTNNNTVDCAEILSVLYDLYELDIFPTKIEKLMCYYLGKEKIEAKNDRKQRRFLLDEVYRVKKQREEQLFSGLEKECFTADSVYGLLGLAGMGLAQLSRIEPCNKSFLELL